ncbi:MAG TPA: hypothetical protein VFR25_00410 [Candidatus Eisenbacteria bacterium]|nr:hypothetical protein [Candidatus Eisenbacteria bacterium]
MRSLTAAAASVMLAAALAGCGGGHPKPAPPPAAAVSVRIPGTELRQGGIAIMGVVEVGEVDQVRPPLVAALDSVLAVKRPEIPRYSQRQVRNAVDDSTARFLLLGYQLHGLVENAWLDRAADSLHDMARFGILARIVRTRVRHDDAEIPVRPGSKETRTVRAAELDAHVQVHVYDLRARTLRASGEFLGIGEHRARPDSVAELPTIRTWVSPEQRTQSMVPPPGGYFEMDPPPLSVAVGPAFAAAIDALFGPPDTTGARTDSTRRSNR